jgi:hypothetical protein
MKPLVVYVPAELLLTCVKLREGASEGPNAESEVNSVYKTFHVERSQEE